MCFPLKAFIISSNILLAYSACLSLSAHHQFPYHVGWRLFCLLYVYPGGEGFNIMIMTVISIHIMHHFIVKYPWRYVYRIRIWLGKTKRFSSNNCHFGLTIRTINDFWMAGIIFSVLNRNKISLHRYQIREHIYYSNQKTILMIKLERLLLT